MLFSSIPFLYTFLPCVLILYFLVPGWLKNTVLLLSSLFFYAWGEPRFVVFMVIAIVQGYVLARLVEKYRADRGRAKLFLTLSLVFSLGLLGYCKYAGLLPLAALTRSRGCPFRCSAWPCPSASAFIPFRSSATSSTSTAAT